MLPWLFVVFAQGAQLRCPREHLALLAARDVKFEDLKHQDVACNACCGIRCQLDDEMTGRSVEYLWMKNGRLFFPGIDEVNEQKRFTHL